MTDVGSLAYTQRRAEEEAQKAIMALEPLPNSPYKDALTALANIAVHRKN